MWEVPLPPFMLARVPSNSFSVSWLPLFDCQPSQDINFLILFRYMWLTLHTHTNPFTRKVSAREMRHTSSEVVGQWNCIPQRLAAARYPNMTHVAIAHLWKSIGFHVSARTLAAKPTTNLSLFHSTSSHCRRLSYTYFFVFSLFGDIMYTTTTWHHRLMELKK